VIAGLSGALLSHESLELAARGEGRLVFPRENLQVRRNALRAWHLSVRGRLGPAAGPRTVFDEVAVPLLSAFGYRVIPVSVTDSLVRAVLDAGPRRVAALIVSAWGRDAASTWRDAVRHGIGFDVRWCFCINGPSLRVVDSRRTYSRRFAEFQLDAAIAHEGAFGVFWQLLSSAAMATTGESMLERAVAATEQHRSEVRKSLQHGVEQSLICLLHAFHRAARATRGRGALPLSSTLDESLIVIYRVLFLLFAEARGLVPRWHPIYRDGYTIESLRTSVEMLPRPPGLWQALQAIARLAARGCRMGSLEVPAFNGRLFSALHSPLSDTLTLDDGEVRRAVLELMTRDGGKRGRIRVAYGDLGVEQLGGIYERLLDLTPSSSRTGPVLIRSQTRKASGSFYTPRSLTEFVVRRTLAPLVQDAAPEQILALRVLDPAMGSGAFLVAACRYLAVAYEAALVREGALMTGDINDAERANFRRAIGQRCLFGVDLNPMAVQLGRLSLWLATLAANRPLTFLDHRLRTGNSLVGAGIADLLRQAPGPASRARRDALPLFPDADVFHALGRAVGVRDVIAAEPDDTLARVRQKERALSELNAADSAPARWRLLADAWCSHWFSERGAGQVPFGAVADAILGRRAVLPSAIADRIRADVQAIAARERFFHWTLEFPEVFFDAQGEPLARPGFDAILGNPPWEMLRDDSGRAEAAQRTPAAGSRLATFARSSGIYRHQGDGHANLYQLFVERAMALVRRGGRLGVILPAGFAVDHGSAGLRRAFLDRTTPDTFVSVENRTGLFPIHRGLKFLLLAATVDSGGGALRCQFGVNSPDALEAMHDTSVLGEVSLTRKLIERISGPSLAIPELPQPIDVEIFADLAFRWPALGDPDGWNVHFGRELNATDDREHFVPATANSATLPVLEGKHIAPFEVHPERAAHRIRPAVAARLLDAPRTFDRARLAYRDVAAATNRLSLIAAIVPAGVVTTHTLFCVKEVLDQESQYFLCGMFNSLVANYLVRPRITTHVSATIIDRLPLPRLSPSSPLFQSIAALARSMSVSPSRADAAALQARAAQGYGVSERQFRHIVGTFPLLAAEQRDEAVRAFCDMMP
jgi:hypothetical protein